MPTKTCRETTHIVSYTCTTDKHTTAEAAEANANHLMMIMIEYSIFSSLLIVAVDYSPLIATTITTTTAMPPSNRYQLCTRIVDSCTLLSMIRNCKPSKHSTHQSSPSSSWKPRKRHTFPYLRLCSFCTRASSSAISCSSVRSPPSRYAIVESSAGRKDDPSRQDTLNPSERILRCVEHSKTNKKWHSDKTSRKVICTHHTEDSQL